MTKKLFIALLVEVAVAKALFETTFSYLSLLVAIIDAAALGLTVVLIIIPQFLRGLEKILEEVLK